MADELRELTIANNYIEAIGLNADVLLFNPNLGKVINKNPTATNAIQTIIDKLNTIINNIDNNKIENIDNNIDHNNIDNNIDHNDIDNNKIENKIPLVNSIESNDDIIDVDIDDNETNIRKENNKQKNNRQSKLKSTSMPEYTQKVSLIDDKYYKLICSRDGDIFIPGNTKYMTSQERIDKIIDHFGLNDSKIFKCSTERGNVSIEVYLVDYIVPGSIIKGRKYIIKTNNIFAIQHNCSSFHINNYDVNGERVDSLSRGINKIKKDLKNYICID